MSSMTFKFHCRKNRGGCDFKYNERRRLASKQETMCPCCGMWGRKIHKPSGEPVIQDISGTRNRSMFSQTPSRANCPKCKVAFDSYVARSDDTYPGLCWPCEAERKFEVRHVHHIHDYDYQDGRTGEDHVQPAFGTRARTRREIRELQKRAREEYFQMTDGPKTYQMTDRETGEKGTMTLEGSGIDTGEIHQSEGFSEAPDHAKMSEDEFRKRVADQVAGKG